MRALTYTDTLRFDPEYVAPTAGQGECLIRVKLAGICATDHHITKGYMGFSGVLGHEMVGIVESGSPSWTGKRVVCEINCVCQGCDMCSAGLSTHCRKRTVLGIAGRNGCFADLVAVPERNLHEVPDSISDEDAVFVEPLAAAYQVVQQVPIDARTKAVVVGSGRLGLLVAQVLSATGCKLEVVGRNAKTLLFCEKKGIQSVAVDDLIARNDRDVVVDCTGSPGGLELAAALVRPRGTIVLKSTYAGASPVDLAPLVVNEVNLLGSRCGPFPPAIQALARKAVDVSSMISRTFPIERGLEAMAASADSSYIKVLLKINPA